MSSYPNICSHITFNSNGLIPVVAQDARSKTVLMLAWMNKTALEYSLETGYMHYFSRSRKTLWRKGETSGQTQRIKKCFLDCDGDSLLFLVEQHGVACHTGRYSCFFKRIENNDTITITEKIRIDPAKLYPPSSPE